MMPGKNAMHNTSTGKKTIAKIPRDNIFINFNHLFIPQARLAKPRGDANYHLNYMWYEKSNFNSISGYCDYIFLM